MIDDAYAILRPPPARDIVSALPVSGPFLRKKKIAIRDMFVVNRDFFFFLSRFTAKRSRITARFFLAFFSLKKKKNRDSSHFVVARFIRLIKALRNTRGANGIRRPV